MDEATAKTKWCPMTRFHYASNGIFDNKPVRGDDYHATDESVYCIGSECMAWRWKLTPSEAANINAQSNAQARANGYCGAFGKP